MDVKVKYLVTAKMNCSRITGGPYVDGVEGESDVMRLDYAENLKDRGKLEITDYNASRDEQSEEDKIKDALMEQAKELDNVSLTRNMKIDTMLKKFKEADVEPNLPEANAEKDEDENQE